MSATQITGLGDSASSKFIYLSVRSGKIAMSATEENHDYVETNSSSGKKYYYTLHGNVNGYIEGVKLFTKEMQDYTAKTLMIHIKNGSSNFSLNMNANSGIASAFYHCMQNIDFSKPVQFSASIDKKNPKRNKLWIRQDDQLVNYFYTREEPKDLPQAERIALADGTFLQENGRDKLDFSKQMSFLWNIIETELKEQINAAKTARNSVAAAQNSALQDQNFLKPDNLDQTELKGNAKEKEAPAQTEFPTAEEVFGENSNDDMPF